MDGAFQTHVSTQILKICLFVCVLLGGSFPVRVKGHISFVLSSNGRWQTEWMINHGVTVSVGQKPTVACKLDIRDHNPTIVTSVLYPAPACQPVIGWGGSRVYGGTGVRECLQADVALVYRHGGKGIWIRWKCARLSHGVGRVAVLGSVNFSIQLSRQKASCVTNGLWSRCRQRRVLRTAWRAL